MAAKAGARTTRRATEAVKMKSTAKSKEKKEILFIIGIVVVVAVLGFVLTQLAASRASAIAGAAIRPGADPTNQGLIQILQEANVVSGVGTCNFLCRQNTCLPVEDSCNIYKVSNDCFCVSPPAGGGVEEGRSYSALVSYLQEAEVLREGGICNDLCGSLGKTCLFANGGAKTCEEVATQCICR